VDGYTVIVLGDDLDAFPEMSLARRDLFEEELMELRACDNVLSISCATRVREKRIVSAKCIHAPGKQ
jgi:hypothetical protein